MKNNKMSLSKVICIIVIAWVAINIVNNFIAGLIDGSLFDEETYEYTDETFSIIASSDNAILDEAIKKHAKKEGYDITIEYADTLEIIDRLNYGEKYDAIYISNSVWLSLLDSSKVKTSSLRSTSISPILFGIIDSKAEELGFKNKKVYTKYILKEIKNCNLKFSMANPLTTNSGASAYIEILTNLAGNPEVLKSSHLKESTVKNGLKDFFK